MLTLPADRMTCRCHVVGGATAALYLCASRYRDGHATATAVFHTNGNCRGSLNATKWLQAMTNTSVGVEEHSRDLAPGHDVQVAARCVRVEIRVRGGYAHAVTLRHLHTQRGVNVDCKRPQGRGV